MASIYGMRPSPASYAWVITIDHIPDETAAEGTNLNAKGVMGPNDAPPDLIARLEKGEGSTFRMYDDDDILYYTGRALSVNDEWDEEACYGPLVDFGRPNAGAVTIKWQGHPERNIG